RPLQTAVRPSLIERGHNPQAHKADHEPIRSYLEERSRSRAAEELDPGPRLSRQSRPMEMDKRPRFKGDTVAKGQVTRRFQLGFFYEDIEDCRVQHAGQQDRAYLTLQGQSVGI